MSGSLLAWLQLFSILMHKHPSLLPPRYHLQCVTALSTLLKMDSTAHEMSNVEVWVLYGLINLARTSVPTFASPPPPAGSSNEVPSTLLRDSKKFSSSQSLLGTLTKSDSETSLLDRDNVTSCWEVHAPFPPPPPNLLLFSNNEKKTRTRNGNEKTCDLRISFIRLFGMFSCVSSRSTTRLARSWQLCCSRR